MNLTDIVGTAGVFLLLLAYFLNLTGKLNKNDLMFLVMNFFGAVLSCVASLMLHYLPFVILEIIWAMVSLIAIYSFFQSKHL